MKRKRFFLVFLCGLAFLQSISAQHLQGNIDLLKERSKQLVLRADYPDSKMRGQLDSLFHSRQPEKGLGAFIFNAGIALGNSGREEEAIKYYSYCLPLYYNILNKDDFGQLKYYILILNQLGLSYANLDLYDLGMNSYLKALDIARQYGYVEEVAVLCNNLSSVYQMQQRYKQSDSLLYIAVSINEQRKDGKKLFVNYNNLSVNFARCKSYNKALEYAFLALHQLDTSKDKDMVELMHLNIGSIYLKRGEIQQAFQLLKEVQIYQEKHHQDAYLIQTYRALYNLFKTMGKDEETPLYLQKALSLAQKYNVLGEEVALLNELSTYYAAKGRIGEAFAASRRASQLKDKLVKQDTDKRMRSLSNVFQEERVLQEHIVKMESNQKALRLRLVWMSVALVGVIAGFLLILRRRIRQNKKNTMLSLFHYGRMKNEQMERQEERVMGLLREQEELKLQIDVIERKRVCIALEATKSKEFVTQLIDRLKQLLLALNPKDVDTRRQIREIISQFNMMETDSTLQEFRDSYENIHRKFYEDLGKLYPSLTAKELRLCTLIRLGLTTKEIADITFKEVRSVESARNRLRKKLQISQTEDLQKFLLKICQ